MISVLYQTSLIFFFFKQKTADEMRISDWSSDVCSSDLVRHELHARVVVELRQRRGRLSLARRRSAERTAGRPDLRRAAAARLAGARPGLPGHHRRWGSEERSVGKKCGRTCRSWWWPGHVKKKII